MKRGRSERQAEEDRDESVVGRNREGGKKRQKR